jgi:hypothetical protein
LLDILGWFLYSHKLSRVIVSSLRVDVRRGELQGVDKTRGLLLIEGALKSVNRL